MCVGFRATGDRARGKKPGVSSGQLAGGELTGNGKFDSGPGRDREARADLPCYKVLRRFELHPGVALLLHRGSRRGVCRGGSHHLELVTRLTALDGFQDEPGGRWEKRACRNIVWRTPRVADAGHYLR